MKSRKRNDIILIAVLLVIAAAAYFAAGGRKGGTASGDESIVITVDDTEVYRKNVADITVPETVDTEGCNGGHNVFVIDKNADGAYEISCTEADCPDKICVETGAVSVPDQPIVCLPHRITARIIKNR